MARLTVLLLIVLAAGCTSPEQVVVYRPVEVLVPVEVPRRPPAELSAEYRPSPLPRFISPKSPDAAAALSKQDLNHLKTLLRTLHTRDEAWREWASEGAPQ